MTLLSVNSYIYIVLHILDIRPILSTYCMEVTKTVTVFFIITPQRYCVTEVEKLYIFSD